MPVSTRASRGRRGRIVDAALIVFAREGYGQASIDAVAAEAGVAKATVYNHLGSKEELLHVAVVEAATEFNARTLDALATLPADPDDLRTALTDLGARLVACQLDPRAWMLMRLVAAEVERFPDLLEHAHRRGGARVTQALADRLARWSLAGRLEIDDPESAAAQLIALVSADLALHSAFGTKEVPDAVVQRTIERGVETFLRAFTPPATR